MIDFIKSGKWGISHGLISASIIALVWVATCSMPAIVAASVLTAFYWARREAVARKTWDIRTWYLDSKLDAIVPIIVSAVAIYMVLFK